jgi:hypothetical protein
MTGAQCCSLYDVACVHSSLVYTVHTCWPTDTVPHPRAVSDLVVTEEKPVTSFFSDDTNLFLSWMNGAIERTSQAKLTWNSTRGDSHVGQLGLALSISPVENAER